MLLLLLLLNSLIMLLLLLDSLIMLLLLYSLVVLQALLHLESRTVRRMRQYSQHAFAR